MKITCLLENTGSDPNLTPKHGLSLFIETLNHTLLFDMGPDDSFARNASALGIDLAAADLAVVSHGHYDHGGGLPRFQSLNPHAPVYMAQGAQQPFFARDPGASPMGIGLDWDAIDKERCRFITRDTKISDHLTLFTAFEASGFTPTGNQSLYRQSDAGALIHDEFFHEMALLVTEKDKTVLFTGCAHSGIGNMIQTVLDRTGLEKIDTIIGGFHLYNPVAGKTEGQDNLNRVAEELSAHARTRFHTGHCTGPEATDFLNQIMDPPLSLLFTGCRIDI